MRLRRGLMAAAVALLILLGNAPVSFAADTPAQASSGWPQFLGDPDAQGVQDASTPRNGSELSLRWEQKEAGVTVNPGTMNWVGMPSTPIIVGDYVYFTRLEYLLKVDLATGETVDKVRIYDTAPNQFYTYLAYDDGMIFLNCVENDLGDADTSGCFLRVFDADTLKQLYVTESIGKGLMETPLICKDGYIATGVYGKNGAYACFTTEDEDPASSTEVKKAVWMIQPESSMGFLGNGAAFVGDYCYFGLGSDIYAVENKTGKYETISMGEGLDNRTTMVYSPETGRFYAAANGDGVTIQSYGVEKNGKLILSDMIEWKSNVQGGGTQSGPVIYNGRLYIAGGGGHSGSNEPFHVLDAKTLKECYSVPVLSKGTPAVATGYATEDNNQRVYVYLVPYRPVDAEGTGERESQLWIIKDSQGQTEADYEVVQPVGRAQYCFQSIAIGGDGSLVWFNDSGYMYCYEKGALEDIKGHWAEEAISELADIGVVSGGGNHRFQPDENATRAQFAQMLFNLSGDGDSHGELVVSQFSDVSDQWFAKAVAWAGQAGVAGGTSETTFSPNAFITRQDMAVMLNNYIEHMEAAHSQGAVGGGSAQVMRRFVDQDSISAYARQAVSRMGVLGLMEGTSTEAGHVFSPRDTVTRAEAATLIYRYMKTLGNNR